MAKGQKKLIKSSVRQSIDQLLDEAEKAWNPEKPGRSGRYAEMVMDLVKKHRIRLVGKQRNRFCKKCLAWWVPGETVTVILDAGNNPIRVRCNKCGYTRMV